jgi:hypothetical protein
MRARLAIAALAGALAGCTGTVTATTPPAAGSAAAPSQSLVSPAAAAPPLTRVHNPGDVTGTLGEPARGHWCHASAGPGGELPDPACTPGSIDPAVTAAVLCAKGYTTRTYRPSSSETTRFKYQQAYPAYGLAPDVKTELDHLVSLQLGGSNDATNLWPEPPPTPNPKDQAENALHAWVCGCVKSVAEGELSAGCRTPADAQDRLESAQQAIAADWITALAVLGVPPATAKPAPARSSAGG